MNKDFYTQMTVDPKMPESISRQHDMLCIKICVDVLDSGVYYFMETDYICD